MTTTRSSFYVDFSEIKCHFPLLRSPWVWRQFKGHGKNAHHQQKEFSARIKVDFKVVNLLDKLKNSYWILKIVIYWISMGGEPKRNLTFPRDSSVLFNVVEIDFENRWRILNDDNVQIGNTILGNLRRRTPLWLRNHQYLPRRRWCCPQSKSIHHPTWRSTV